MSGTLYDVIAAAESSGGQNVWGPQTSSGQAEGYYQITTGTWQQYAPQAGVSLSQYATPNDAPQSVQELVASVIPLDRWAPSTVQSVEGQYAGAFSQGAVNSNETLGQISEALTGNATPASVYGGQAPASDVGQSATTSGSSGGILSGIASWVERGFLIAAAVVIIAVALWWILAEAGAMPSPKQAAAALAV